MFDVKVYHCIVLISVDNIENIGRFCFKNWMGDRGCKNFVYLKKEAEKEEIFYLLLILSLITFVSLFLKKEF